MQLDLIHCASRFYSKLSAVENYPTQNTITSRFMNLGSKNNTVISLPKIFSQPSKSVQIIHISSHPYFFIQAATQDWSLTATSMNRSTLVRSCVFVCWEMYWWKCCILSVQFLCSVFSTHHLMVISLPMGEIGWIGPNCPMLWRMVIWMVIFWI